MWKKISEMLKPKINSQQKQEETLEKLRIATASLLFRAGNIDGNISEIEMAKLSKILKNHFDLSRSELETLMNVAGKGEKESIDLYGFTKIITEQLDQAGRMEVVELIWKVILADGVIDEFEANLVWRVAELIGVSTRDRVRLKRKVMSAQR